MTFPKLSMDVTYRAFVSGSARILVDEDITPTVDFPVLANNAAIIDNLIIIKPSVSGSIFSQEDEEFHAVGDLNNDGFDDLLASVGATETSSASAKGAGVRRRATFPPASSLTRTTC